MKKIIISIMLSFIIITTSIVNVKATGFEGAIVAGSSAFGPGGVIIAVLAMGGVLVVVDNRKEIADVIEYTAQQAYTQAGISANKVKDFYFKAQAGIIDTTSGCWDILVNQCQSWYYGMVAQSANVFESNNLLSGATIATIGTMTWSFGDFSSNTPFGYKVYSSEQSTGWIELIVYGLPSANPINVSVYRNGSYFGRVSTSKSSYVSLGSDIFHFGNLTLLYSKVPTISVLGMSEPLFVASVLSDLGKSDLLDLGVEKILSPSNTTTSVSSISTDIDTDYIDVNAVAKGLTGDNTATWEDVLEKLGSGELAYEDVIAQVGITDIPIPTDAIPTTQDIAQTLTDAQTTDIAPTVTADSSASSYSLPILGIFPFCIPFDIHAFISAFWAEPVAPSVTLSVMIPIVDVPFGVHLDMSKFDGVASLIRGFECLLFLMGLMFITSKVIKW